jgi:hypothetical protein
MVVVVVVCDIDLPCMGLETQGLHGNDVSGAFDGDGPVLVILPAVAGEDDWEAKAGRQLKRR